VRLGQVADLLDRHLAGDDPLADYPAHLRVPELADQPLRGYLTGSIDVVLRLPGPRYLIVDYKTNRLGDPDQERLLTVGDYRPGPMAAAMIGANYPLQALLYSVALHRFLRWRQPGYDPELHLGGALYLFVRGMAGPETPLVDGTPCGVFGWRPSGSLVSELSALLDGSTS
jgi:exodeoxyribonuclease V beta subunit